VLLELEFGVELMSDELPAPDPDTLTLSTTFRLPANDCAIRFASSRSFCEGAVPLSVTESELTSTDMLLEVRVGSLRNAVWMSFLIWSVEPLLALLPVVLLIDPDCPAGVPTEEDDPVSVL
jgi:hypothetical protein